MGSPLALMDGNDLVGEEGTVRHRVQSCKITGREVIDDSGLFVEEHVELHVARRYALAVHTDAVVIVNDETR